ncbi:MAG: hypothetical protein H5U02_14990 [Clostridia bacterium]|nr:hypothetical protein [Clostridia bacterium]
MPGTKLEKATKKSWILKLNPKGQATIPAEVRRSLGLMKEDREIELVWENGSYKLKPHKAPIPIRNYIGFAAEELENIEDAVGYIRELRGRGVPSTGLIC